MIVNELCGQSLSLVNRQDGFRDQKRSLLTLEQAGRMEEYDGHTFYLAIGQLARSFRALRAFHGFGEYLVRLTDLTLPVKVCGSHLLRLSSAVGDLLD
uniref:Uncharacterized protein n=1 Tax=Vespula pensylvanica TaxID=30213 RepID=A0A834PC15_VESPE|nr:hypothetical protein H0235_003735 [Vespula pensylvanica]